MEAWLSAPLFPVPDRTRPLPVALSTLSLQPTLKFSPQTATKSLCASTGHRRVLSLVSWAEAGGIKGPKTAHANTLTCPSLKDGAKCDAGTVNACKSTTVANEGVCAYGHDPVQAKSVGELYCG